MITDTPIQRLNMLNEPRLHALPSTGTYKPMSDYELADQRQDLRGRTFVEGEQETAIIQDMLVNPDTNRVEIIELSDGRRIPITYIRLKGQKVFLAEK